MAQCEIQPGLFRYLFGDRWKFAIEVEVAAADPQPTSWGSLWLWFNGEIVGNPQAEEQLGIAADWLKYLASPAAHRPGSVFGDLDAPSRLKLFEWWFSQSKEKPPYTWWVDPDIDATPYFLSHIQAGPALDHWWAILMEDQDSELVTWRAPGSTMVRESRLPKGTFNNIVLDFLRWLNKEEIRGESLGRSETS
jgi:hypothetical protein